MDLYQNISGDSSIYAYDTGSDFITVYFINGNQYTYSYKSAGTSNVEQMKNLARAGSGLNSFIIKNCKKDYE
jgi:hypothetical protein